MKKERVGKKVAVESCSHDSTIKRIFRAIADVPGRDEKTSREKTERSSIYSETIVGQDNLPLGTFWC